MSIPNSKDIINILKNKYVETPWGEFLETAFNQKSFQKLIDAMVNLSIDKKKFYPKQALWFTDFMSITPSEVKVVVVHHSKLKGDALMPDFYTSEEFHRLSELEMDLYGKGVFLLELARTKDAAKEHGSTLWRDFNASLVEDLANLDQRPEFIFIGFDAGQYAEMLTDDNLKSYLPELKSAYWNKSENLVNVKNIFEKHGIEL